MATRVAMPQLGETVTEGTILSWAKQVGDTIGVDEVLLEISTDKVDTEVPSPVAGTILEILAAEGDTVPVGTDLVIIGEAGESSASEAAPVPAVSAPEVESASTEPPAAAPPAAPAQPAEQPAAHTDGEAESAEATTVSMPQLGETVTEGTILSWAKQVGDSIGVDEVLVEISTDKVDTEVPSPVAGTILELLAAEGDTIPVGAPMARIGSGSAVTTTPPASVAGPAASPTAPSPPPASPPSASPPSVSPPLAAAPAPPLAAAAAASIPEGAFFSPVVRKLAKENNVDLGSLAGTGKGGRITRRDIEQFITNRPAGSDAAPPTATPSSAPTAPPSAPASAPAPAASAPPTPVPASAQPAAAPASDVPTMAGDRVEDLDRLRARIGANMIKAKETAAHVWTSVEVDFEKVERVRQAHKAAFKATEGFSLTYLPFIARATVDALREYPIVNSSFYLEQRKAVYHNAINLGVAIDLNQAGLIVAAIKNADSLGMAGLARGIRSVADRARSNKLEPDDIAGSTFTITNPGPFGSFMSAPIINVPNVAILSTDTVSKRPAVITTADGQDTIAIRHIGYLGLTWDHRAFDGSTAVLFLARIKENLETWDWEQELG